MAWERVIESLGSTPTVHRAAVPGGWLYASFNNMVFVPHSTSQGEKVTPDDTKRRDELGAAYARGFADGKGEKVTPSNPKEAALTELNRVLYIATDTGLFDDIAAHSHPDIINKFCDAVEYFSKRGGK